MAYDEEVAERVRETLSPYSGIREQKMFGGLAFMVEGHMCCGVLGSELVLRLGEEGADASLEEAHTRLMDFTGKPMRSMIYVNPAGFETAEALVGWVERAVRFVRTLPPKQW